MSTSETVKFDVCDCPCGKGKIVKYVTTQDNRWSGADISQEIECDRCRSEWSLNYNTLTLRSSTAPYDQAMRRERALYEEIDAVASEIFQQQFELQNIRTKKDQLSYFTESGLTSMNYRQYLKHLSDGNPPWAACRWPRSIDWLLESCDTDKRATLNSLFCRYNKAREERELAAKQIITRGFA